MATQHASMPHSSPLRGAFAQVRRLIHDRRLTGVNVARSALLLILILTALLGVAFAMNPQWDLALTRPFYDPATKQFPLTFNATISWIRDQAVFVTLACMSCLIVSVALKLIWPRRSMLIPGRAVIFLALSFALGPGLLVNGILKEEWSRPRPAEVVEFGGDKTFMPWWDPRGGCDQNCSFVSGETSTAAWTLAPAMLVPGPLGMAAVGAAVIFTLGMATIRFIVGGHFFTDVAFAILFTSLVIWAVHGLVYRWPKTALDDEVIEHALGRLGLLIRRRGAILWQHLRAGTSGAGAFARQLTTKTGSRLGLLGIDAELIARVQDLRQAYLGAPENRIVAEALELFIAGRLAAEPEVKRRYDEARRRRLGLSGGPVRLIAEKPDENNTPGNVVALPAPPTSE